MSSSPLSLFSAFGIELEYMIVDAQSLDVRPIADEVMQLEAGSRYRISSSKTSVVDELDTACPWN